MRKSSSRRKGWLIAAAALAALTALVLLGLYIAVATIDVAAYRTQIEAMISRSLDRDVKIGGTISLERSLTPRFVVEDVRIANPPWASRPWFATARRLDIQVALLPLLTRRLEVVQFGLVDADIRLERRRDGTPNWIFRRQDTSRDASGMVAEVVSLDIQRSKIVYRQSIGTDFEVRIAKLTTTVAPERPISIYFAGDIQQIPITLQLDGGNLANFLSPTAVWKFVAKASLGNLRAEAQGSAIEPLKLAGMGISFRYYGVRAGGIRSLLTERVPQLAEYRGSGHFTSGANGFGFDLQAQGSDIALARLWGGRDADSALAINARHLEINGQGTAAQLSNLLTRAHWKLAAQGAELRWRHSADKPLLELSETEVAAETSANGLIAMHLQGNVAGKPFTARGTLGTLETLVAAKTPWAIEADAEAGDARGEFRGALLKPLVPARLEATFVASSDRLATLGEIAGFALPPAGPARITGRLTVHGAERVDLSALDVAVADSRARGSIVWQRAGAPRVSVTLAPSRVRIEDLHHDGIPGATRPAAHDDTAAARVIPDIAFGGNIDRRADIGISLDRVELVHAGKVLASLTGTVRLANRRLELGPLHSDTGDAPINATIVFDASVDPARLDAEVDARSIDYGGLLRAGGVTNGVQGRLDLRAHLTANGNSLHTLLGSTSGKIEIVGGEGRLQGRLLEIWGGNFMQILNPVAWAEDSDTELNCVAGQFDLADGIARSRTLLVDSKSVTVAGEVVLNLRSEQVDGIFKSQPKEATLVHLGRPLRLSGTLKAPKVGAADRGLVTLGKIAVGVVQPAALIVLFGDLGAKEKNPCAALLAKRSAEPQPDPATER